MLAAGRAHTFERFVGRFAAGLASEVAEANHSNQTVIAVENRETADLSLAHHVGNRFNVVILARTKQSAVINCGRCIRTLAFSDAPGQRFARSVIMR